MLGKPIRYEVAEVAIKTVHLRLKDCQNLMNYYQRNKRCTVTWNESDGTDGCLSIGVYLICLFPSGTWWPACRSRWMGLCFSQVPTMRRSDCGTFKANRVFAASTTKVNCSPSSWLSFSSQQKPPRSSMSWFDCLCSDWSPQSSVTCSRFLSDILRASISKY